MHTFIHTKCLCNRKVQEIATSNIRSTDNEKFDVSKPDMCKVVLFSALFHTISIAHHFILGQIRNSTWRSVHVGCRHEY